MTQAKESNFISAVVYLRNDAARVEPFLKAVCAQLEEHFAQYELIAVDDCSTDGTAQAMRDFAAGTLTKPLTLLHMSLAQGVELCMNAGQDCAIGDFVYEFDAADLCYDPALIWKAYETALLGNDVVSVGPSRQKLASRAFYGVFNRFSRSAYPIATDAFRLLSRRGINRVHAISPGLPYRKAAYAASGLAQATLTFEGVMARRTGDMTLAADSLVLYTNAGFKLSFGVAAGMMALALLELVYTLAVFFGHRFVEGWVTTMFVLTVGFAGVFGILAIVIKYLSLILEMVFRRQTYLVESVEKIQK